MPADTPAYAYILNSSGPNVSGTIYNFSAVDLTMANGPVESVVGIFTLTRSVLIDGSAIAGTFTVNSGTDVVTTGAAHGLHNFQQVRPTSTGTLPGGLASINYFAQVLTSTTFKLFVDLVGDLTLTAVDISASAGSGTHSMHAGQTAFSLAGSSEFAPGFYASTLLFAALTGGTRSLDLLWKVSDHDTSLLNGFLAPFLEDATVRDLRVDLRLGTVNGYAFDPSTTTLRLPLGAIINGLILLRDIQITFVADATAVTLIIFPENNFDAPALIEVVADAVEQFAEDDFPNLWGHPCVFTADSAPLRAAMAGLRALGGAPSLTRELPCSGVIRYTRSSEVYRSSLFKVTFVQ